MNLPYLEGDMVVCRFSVMFFPNKCKAFRETFPRASARRPLPVQRMGQFLDKRRLSPDHRGSYRWFRHRSRPAHDSGPALPRRPADPVGSCGGGVHRNRIGEGFRTEPRGFGPGSGDDRLPGSMLRSAIEAHDPSGLEEITGKVAEALLSRFGQGPIEGTTRAVLVTAARPRP